MTKIEQMLAIWTLANDKTSVPKSYDAVCRELSSICPDQPAQECLDRLRLCNYVELNCQGEYILTRRGLHIRKTLPDKKELLIPKEVRTGHEWDRFRKILSYYIDCVHFQEKTQQYLHHDKLNREFFVPVLGVNWLPELGEGAKKQIIAFSREQQSAAQKLLTRKDDDEEVYIGYPVEAFRCRGTESICYSPVGLIPVDITEATKTTMTLSLRIEEAEINQSYIEYKFKEEERDAVLNTILSLHKNDEFRGMIDLRKSLPQFEKGDVRLEPDNVCVNFQKLEKSEKCKLCNVAVLFVGQPLRYSKTLRRELKYIRDNVSDEVLDKTALAYIFREPALRNSEQENKHMPIPFIESNPEQMSAVDAALNRGSSKITGPPGTGKSQVSVNIIANYIFNGKKVLFTSRNHKAVEAIWERCKKVLNHNSLALVNFCTQDDPNPWYEQDLDILTASAGSLSYEIGDDATFYVNEAVDKWRNLESTFVNRDKILTNYEKLVHNHSKVVERMNFLLSSNKTQNMTAEEYSKLCASVRNLNIEPKFSLKSLAQWLNWKIWGRKNYDRAVQYIRTNYASFWENVLSIPELKEQFNKFSVVYKEFVNLKRQLEQCENEARNEEDIQKREELLAKSLKEISEKSHNALAIQMCEKIKELEDNIDIKNKLKSIMNFMRSSNSPAFFQRQSTQNAQKAEEGFKLFQKYYPGWATTLLSLTRSSPCLPGLFDAVIVDEASQCDPASVIPALYRSKSIVFIGDSNQFPPVVDMKQLRNDFLKTKSGITEIEDQRYDFMEISAFDLSSESAILLREHFRCADEITEFFNETFYNNNLSIRTDKNRLVTPTCMGYKHAVEWIDIVNSLAAEKEAVIKTVKELFDNDYPGTIGVITPFRNYANDLREALYCELCEDENYSEEKLLVNTANAFQGGERDVIIFTLGYNDELTKGKLWYAESSENRYIYNVAVSRARACLIIVGDRQRCARSSSYVLRQLAEMPRDNSERKVKKLFESPWEKKFYDALLEVGIETKPQYPVMGRRLDLAYIEDNLKIDIEIDGVHYHTDSTGNRKMDDIYRDLQVGAVGWLVMRFWVYELRDNMEECVSKIRDCIEKKHG